MKTLEDRVRNLEDAVRRMAITLLIAVILFAVFFFTSCTPTSKMVEPDGCKPKKEIKHEMIKPEPKIERDDRQDN